VVVHNEPEHNEQSITFTIGWSTGVQLGSDGSLVQQEHWQSRPRENGNKEKITILARIIDFILAINIKLLKSEEFRQSILTAFLLTTFCLKFVYEIMILC
jgi:hypothetical protein